MFKKLLFLHSQLSRTVSQGKWQHRVFLSCSQSGACRAHRRASHAPQGSPKEMPSSHTARPPASTLPVALLSLSTSEPLHPQFYNSLQAHPLQSVHFSFSSPSESHYPTLTVYAKMAHSFISYFQDLLPSSPHTPSIFQKDHTFIYFL